MATVQWSSATDGIFQNPLQWQGGAVPSATDTAVLGSLGGTPYTVVSKSGTLGLLLGGTQTVGAIQTASNATLEVVGDIDALDLLAGNTTFSATAGTGGGVNAGKIVVQDAVLAITVLGVNHLLGASATLKIGGSFDNTGTVSINGQPHLLGVLDSDQTANLEIVGKTALTGGGHVTLSDQTNNFVFGAVASTAVLDNVDNTISGAGVINRLTLENQAAGVIDATGVHDLVISSLRTLTNAGVIEASSHGTLVFTRTTVANTGTIEAQSGARVLLISTDIQGGTVKTVGSGLIVTNNTANTFDGSTTAVMVDGHVRVRDGTALTLDGAIHNSGQITIASLTVQPKITTLIVGADGATLSGGGQIRSTSQALNRIEGVTAASTLTNVDNTMLISGNLGAGRLTLVNETLGRIIAGESTGLTINTGAITIVNAGRIYATGKGGLTIDSAVNNTGFLEAVGGNLTLNGVVTGTGAALIRNGKLDATSAFSENVVFLPLKAGGATSGVLELAHSASYTGTVTGFSKTGATSLDLADIAFNTKTKATYAGSTHSGVLTVTNGASTAHIHLIGNFTGSSFIVSSDGHGGTTVKDPTSTTAGRLAAAMAQMPAHSATMNSTAAHLSVMPPMLASPGLHAA